LINQLPLRGHDETVASLFVKVSKEPISISVIAQGNKPGL
jgi:hypothetical protein